MHQPKVSGSHTSYLKASGARGRWAAVSSSEVGVSSAWRKEILVSASHKPCTPSPFLSHFVPLPVPEACDWKQCHGCSLQYVCFTEERMQIATDQSMCPMKWQEGGASFELQREGLPDARELALLRGVQHI